MAIRQLSDQQHATPGKPFFMYFATGAQHAPHQAPPEWIDRYRGKFDGGWERWREAAFGRQLDLGIVPEGTQCTGRPPWVQEWDALPPEERRLFARMQEVFAGFLSHTDHQIGRILSALESRGLLDDTIVVLLSDNGASAEGSSIGSLNEGRFTLGLDRLEDNVAHIDEWGGFRLYNHYAWGWAWAGNTPFHLWKRYAWLGGTRVPLIVHWPAGIRARGEVRSQFCHVVDLMPTLLDACGVSVPAVVDGVAQQAVDGASLRLTFDEADAPAPRQQQYFEMLGSRSMYLDGWKATTNRVTSGVADEQRLIEGSASIDDDTWALFNLEEDFAEANDLSDAHPELVRRLEQLWWAEAGRNHVLPMGNWMARALPDAVMAMSPPARSPMGRKVFLPGAGPIADEAVPMLAFGGRIEVDVQIPEGGGQGVLCAQGNWTGGWALVVTDGRLAFLVNSLSTPYAVHSDGTLPAGRKMIGVEYRLNAEGPSEVSLWVDDNRVGTGALPAGTVLGGQADGNALRLGYDSGFPVSDEYTPPFPWTGGLHHVVVEGGPMTRSHFEREIADIVHRD